MSTELQFPTTLAELPTTLATIGGALLAHFIEGRVAYVRIMPGDGTQYRFAAFAGLDPDYTHIVFTGDDGRYLTIYVPPFPAPHFFQTGTAMTDALLADVVNAIHGKFTSYYVEYCKTHRGGH